MTTTPGLHHVTAIGGDPERNAGFYVDTLGLRFVKRTVNHDDTDTYHLYYGDGVGTPGTNVTFFPWTDGGRQGEFGAGQTQSTAFSVPASSYDYWRERLESRGLRYSEHERFGDPVLQFSDPDGIGLELVFHDGERPGEPWLEGPVPMEHQIRGFHGVTLALGDTALTAELLEGLGYERVGTEGERTRYDTGADRIGTAVDLVETSLPRGEMGVGTVHHVAFEVATDEQEALRDQLRDAGLNATDPIDRKYFTAIYAREPGGVLFEFATPEPGFTVDEDAESLGERLTLPEWLEDERADIEASLPAFDWDPDRERTPTTTDD